MKIFAFLSGQIGSSLLACSILHEERCRSLRVVAPAIVELGRTRFGMAQELLNLLQRRSVLEGSCGAGRPHRLRGVAGRHVDLPAPALEDPVDLPRGELAVSLVRDLVLPNSAEEGTVLVLPVAGTLKVDADALLDLLEDGLEGGAVPGRAGKGSPRGRLTPGLERGWLKSLHNMHLH